MPVKKYGDQIEAQVKVLARSGDSERTIAKQLGIPKSSVHKILNRPGNPEVEQIEAQTSSEFAKKLKKTSNLLLKEMLGNPDKIKNAKAKDLMVCLGISIEKQLLLEGGATEIIGIMGLVGKTDQELDKIMKGEVEVTDAKKEPQPAEATKHKKRSRDARK